MHQACSIVTLPHVDGLKGASGWELMLGLTREEFGMEWVGKDR
jgi:hypothetical protein